MSVGFVLLTLAVSIAVFVSVSDSPSPSANQPARNVPAASMPPPTETSNFGFIVGVIVLLVVLVLLFGLRGRWSSWFKRLVRDDPDHPLVFWAALVHKIGTSVAVLVAIMTPPIGWLFIYLWHIENEREKMRQEFYTALDEARSDRSLDD